MGSRLERYESQVAAERGLCDEAERFMGECASKTSALRSEAALIMGSPLTRAWKLLRKAVGRPWSFEGDRWLQDDESSSASFSQDGAVDLGKLQGDGDLKGAMAALEGVQARKRPLFKACEEAYRRCEETDRAYRELLETRAARAWAAWRRATLRPYEPLESPYDFEEFKVGIFGAPALSQDAASWFEALRKEAVGMPESNGSAYFDKAPARIGVIAGEFALTGYRDFCDFVPLTFSNYGPAIKSGKLDALLYVSCWKSAVFAGEESCAEIPDFEGVIGTERVVKVMDYARKEAPGTPIVFQSVEDPPSFDWFLPIARCADAVFTTAQELLGDYREKTQARDRSVLTYGVNPHLHNPIGFLRKHGDANSLIGPKDVLFAGAWYKKFEKRCEDTRMLFEGVLADPDAQLVCVDRSYWEKDKYWFFPEEYAPYIVPSLPYGELQKAHKLFDWAINLSSVTDSRTMCARRVYEVQALGCLMLSNYALSIAGRFPGVFTVLEQQEVPLILNGYTEGEVLSMQLEGIRDMLGNHTMPQHLGKMLGGSLGADLFSEPSVYVICDPDDASVRTAIARQSLKGATMVSPADASALGEGPGFIVRWIGDGHNRDYLLDMVNAFKCADVRYVRYVPASEAARAYDFSEEESAPDDAMFDLSKVPVGQVLAGSVGGEGGFSIIGPRWGRDVPSGEKDLAVIVPVATEREATFLQKRSFRSLLRSSVFERMRVCIVGGASDDADAIIEEIVAAYPNVEHHETKADLDEAAAQALSGASERAATLLHPMNEVLGDGYAKMLRALDGQAADVVVGGLLKAVPDGVVRMAAEGSLDAVAQTAMFRPSLFRDEWAKRRSEGGSLYDMGPIIGQASSPCALQENVLADYRSISG